MLTKNPALDQSTRRFDSLGIMRRRGHQELILSGGDAVHGKPEYRSAEGIAPTMDAGADRHVPRESTRAMSTGTPSQANDTTMLDEFYRAYGGAMFAWQEVETALFKLYHSIRERSGDRDIMASSRAYYAKHSFGPKLRLVNGIARAPDVSTLIDWPTLHKDLRDASQERNALAHRPVRLVPDGPGVKLQLDLPLFAPLAMHTLRAWGRPYDAAGCQSLANDFDMLAKYLHSAFQLMYRDTRTP